MTIETITQKQIDELRSLNLYFEEEELTQKVFPTEYAEIFRLQDQIKNIVNEREVEIQETEIKYRRNGVPANRRLTDKLREYDADMPIFSMSIGDENLSGSRKKGIATAIAKNPSALFPGTLQKKIEAIVAKYDPQIEKLCEQRAEAEKPILEMYKIIEKVENNHYKSSDKPFTVTQSEYETLKALDQKYTQLEAEARKKSIEQQRTIVVLR